MVIYLKNVDTGVVRTLDEWKEKEIKFFTNLFNEDQNLQDEFKTVENYLKWIDERGCFYTDLVECDENGNIIDHNEAEY